VDAKVICISAALKGGSVVPAPMNDDAYSGKFVTRIGKSTHRRIAAAAKRDGVSLNAWVMEAVNFRLGDRESERSAPGDRSDPSRVPIGADGRPEGLFVT
jgi:hypothetical protein